MSGIALITSPYLKSFYREALDKFSPELNVDIFEYDNFSGLPDIYREIESEYEGFLVSGRYVRSAIEKQITLRKPLLHVETDITSVCFIVLKILAATPNASLDRVVFDFLIPVGLDGSLNNIWSAERQQRIGQAVDDWLGSCSLEDLERSTRVTVDRLEGWWRENKIDHVINALSHITPMLQDLGVPFTFAYPSQDEVKMNVRLLLSLIENSRMRSNLSAVISISSNRLLGDRQDMNLDAVKLQKALLDFNRDYFANFLLYRSYNGFHVFTSLSTVLRITDNLRHCSLRSYLARNLGFPVSIGYGISSDLVEAKSHADDAVRKGNMDGSYVINEQKCLIGPLGSNHKLQVDVADNSNMQRAAQKAGLSTLTLGKIQSLVDVLQSNQITTTDMSERLGMTKRNANRILKKMANAGFAEVLDQRAGSSRGRPSKVYEIKL